MANKNAVLVPPATHADVNWVRFHFDSVANQVVVTVDAAAVDVATGARDVASVALNLSPANANVQAIYTAAINAWKTAKGY